MSYAKHSVINLVARQNSIMSMVPESNQKRVRYLFSLVAHPDPAQSQLAQNELEGYISEPPSPASPIACPSTEEEYVVSEEEFRNYLAKSDVDIPVDDGADDSVDPAS